jgi:predicted permease
MTFTTIDPDGPWEYLPVLNVCLQIMFTIGLGGLLGRWKIFDAEKLVPVATKFVFYVALPLLVLLGLGVNIDFYDDSFVWAYIAAFLCLRAICLLVSILIVLWNGHRQVEQHQRLSQGTLEQALPMPPTSDDNSTDRNTTKTTTLIGQVGVLWLSLSWISTVILGIPIAGAVFDKPTLGATYGLLAGISSFIFQLPLQLFFFECHKLEISEGHSEVCRDTIGAMDIAEQGDLTHGNNRSEHENGHVQIESQSRTCDLKLKSSFRDAKGEKADQDSIPENTSQALGDLPYFRLRFRLWKPILLQIIQNPVILGIIGGFILSLSTVGPRFLKASSDDFVPGFQWFAHSTKWLGDCVSPVSLFTMGVWMEQEGRQIFQIPPLHAFLFMLSKLIFLPMIMLGLAKLLDLDNEAGRAAVLISALPISMASFSLGSRYGIGEAVLSENVVLGTLLIVPTVLLWNIALDAVGVFPIEK